MSLPAVDPLGGPAVSVIVPATDHRLTLPRCVSALEVARGASDELIVVHDAALPGPSSARNLGAVAASNSILVFVDADVEVRSDAIERIRERFMSDPGLAAVFGSYDDDPEERDVVSTFRNLLHHHVHQHAAGEVDSFWAGLGAVRRGVFDAVGGFDTGTASMEDVEFGARLRVTWRIELDPAIQGKHLKRWTLPGMLGTDLRHRGIPWTRLALRGRATRRGLNLAWRHRLSAASSLLIALSLTRRRPMAATASLSLLVALNQSFYRLLAGRGRRYVVGGVGLHVLHHLTSVVALTVGAISVVPRRRRTAQRTSATGR